jgi:hypothetical protein
MAMKAVVMPTNPNSVGLNKRARITPAIKVMPELNSWSMKLQMNPLTVLCFNADMLVGIVVFNFIC